ncbi:hypothetical protein MBLNU230_g3347t1 [Neophaeotheca triangularis]
MPLNFSTWATLSLACLASTSYAGRHHNNLVSLDDYGTFSGTTVNETYSGYPLPHPVDAWLGMDYARQPVGDLRFTPSTWPSPFDGVRDADSYGMSCIQELSVADIELQSEACLNFNVYRTPGVPLDQKLPVLVWIHGGSMYAGNWRSFDGASFAASSPEPMVVVTFHYRVNSLGSLPSRLMDEEGLSNLNIRDQRLFLEFVQKYIHAFGGDADSVTLGGRSAGAHSVGIHYFHNYGEDAGSKPLFARAIHQPGAVTARMFPPSDFPLYQAQYRDFMTVVGCPMDGTNAEALECLRTADVNTIRNISTAMYRDYELDWAWPFQPVQGGELFEKPGSVSGIDGTFFHVPTISSTVTNEARYWETGDFGTNLKVLDFWADLAPGLNEADLKLFQELYPDPQQYPDSPYANSEVNTQYSRFQAAVSDYAYICPSQETSYRVSSAGVPTWKLRFNTNNTFPPEQGVPHTADTRYTWNEPDVQYPEIGKVYHSYLASFVLTGDPNTHRYPGSPEWANYEPAGYGLDSAPGQQLVVQPGPGGNGSSTRLELDDVRREECLFWRDPERMLRINK